MAPTPEPAEDELRPEYDLQQLRGGVRGKYAERNNVVVLSPEVADYFPDSASVNEALQALVNLARKSMKKVAS